MRRSFTLVELLVSVAIFSMLIVFLFQTLNISHDNSKRFQKHTQDITKTLQIKDIITKDFLYLQIASAQNDQQIVLEKNKDSNTILKIKTTNTYYNPFFNHITYVLTKEKNLYRIESNKFFDKNSNFLDLEDAYIYKILEDVEYFRISPIKGLENKGYGIYMKQNNMDILFSAVSF